MDEEKAENQQTPTSNEPKTVEVKLLDERHKFYDFSQILLNDDYFDNILKVLVGKGDSILIKNDPI
jgi:hypothetical protein